MRPRGVVLALVVLALLASGCDADTARPAESSESVFITSVPLPVSEVPFVPDVQRGQVVRVLGGGRLLVHIESGRHMRVITIGALSPFGRSCHANAARRLTARLAPIGSEVTISVDRFIGHRNAKGFQVRYVDIDPVDLADRLLIAGEALFSSEVVQTDEFERRPKYERHWKNAVRAERGLWGDCL